MIDEQYHNLYCCCNASKSIACTWKSLRKEQNMRYILSIMIAVALASAGVVHPQLSEILKTQPANEPIAVIVHMVRQADWSSVDANATKAEKLLYLQNLSEADQADLLAYLASLGDKVTVNQTWWIFNGLMFTSTKDVIEAVAARADVDYVIDDFIIYLDDARKPGNDEILTPEWNITKVSAPLCWNDGFDGSGVIVGNMDTGVYKDHACFGGRWVAGGWFDAVNGQPNPYDDHGHGTHTMGTTCGGDGNGSYTYDIGVAPGANFIMAKVFNSSGSGQSSWIHNGFSWFAGQNAVVVGNSWGSSSTTSTEYWNDCMNWRNLGIYPSFSIGNNGPGSGTAGTPGNFPTVTGVGATDSGDNIVSFSSRGPAPNMSPWTDTQYWERPDWNRTKPDISAPGNNIRSASPSGGFAYMSGTSMACPHLTGAVALCLQKNSSLDYGTLYNILLDNADHPSQGGTYPNNNYGWGRLNCYAALNAVPSGNAPNLVISSVAVVGGNGNGQLDPGETAGIVCYIDNNGQNQATNTQGTLRTSDSYITITDSTYTYGNIPAGGSADNSSDPYDVTVAGGCPVGHVVDFELELACSETTFVRTFQLTVGTVGEDWVSHNCGNCILTVTRWGSIGFMTDITGEGFHYPVAGANHLYCSSFAVGTTAAWVVDRYYETGGAFDADWVTTPGGEVIMQEPGPGTFDEYATASYDDSGHGSSRDLLCEQKSWAWDDATANDFVIMRFDLTNNGSSAISNFYAAVFVDWDIGTYSNNQGSSEGARNLTWMYETGNPYVGVEILDPPRSTPAANLAFIDHDIYVYPNQGLPDNYQIQFMDGTISMPQSDRAYDWSTCNSAGPFSLGAGETLVTAFAILGGTSLSDFQANADTAYNRYWGSGVYDDRDYDVTPVMTTISPVVSRGDFTIAYNLSIETPVRVQIFDAAGRLVEGRECGKLRGTGELQLDLRSYAHGVYFVKVETADKTTTTKVIKLQ